MIRPFLTFASWWVSIHCRLRGMEPDEMSKWEVILGYTLAAVVFLALLFLIPAALASMVI